MEWRIVLEEARKARATDAKEVGVKDPAEETFCHPNRNVIKNDIIDFQKVNRTPPRTVFFAGFQAWIGRFVQFLVSAVLARERELPHSKQAGKRHEK
jgi:hypothetical protein